MGMKTNQDQTPESTQISNETLSQINSDHFSRRNFAKLSLGASGVLLTLASRPVLGAVACKSPSGFLSGNASTHGAQPVCQGRSPGYWKNHVSSWPSSLPPETKFSSVFITSPSSVYAKYTFLQLLTHQDDDRHNLGMHLVAAYLNAISGWTPFLTIETIRAMFTEWQSTGAFSPTATVQWGAPDIVYYLKATQA